MKMRPGKTQDWAALADIIISRRGDSSCYSKLEMSNRAVRDYVMSLVADRDTTFMVLEDAGRAVGFLAMTEADLYFSSTRCASDSLYVVAKGYEGHGAQMLRTYLKHAKDRGVHHIEMTVANGLKDNDRTYRFYESIGMKEIGRVYHMELDSE